MPGGVQRRRLRTDSRELCGFLELCLSGNNRAGVAGKINLGATGANLHRDAGARADGVAGDAELMNVADENDFGCAAVAGKFIAFDPESVTTFEARFAEEDAGFAVIGDPVVADQMVGVAFADGDAGASVVTEHVVLADRILGAQAIENAAAGIVFADVVRHDIPDRTTAGMQAGAFVVMQMTSADEDIGALLEADGIAVVIGDLDILNDGAVNSEQNDAAAPAAVDAELFFWIAVECQAANGNIGDIVAANQRKGASHPRATRRRVVVCEWPVDEEVVAFAPNDCRDSFVEAKCVLVTNGDAHANFKLTGFFDLELVLPVANPWQDGTADARDLFKNRAWFANEMNAAAQMQGVIHLVDASRYFDNASAFAGDGIHSCLQCDVCFTFADLDCFHD